MCTVHTSDKKGDPVIVLLYTILYVCTLAVLEISLKCIRNVAPMLKTCVFTIWTCEKKDGCNRRLMWRAISKILFNSVCATICLWESNLRTAYKQYEHSFLRPILKKIKTKQASRCYTAHYLKREHYIFKVILFWTSARGDEWQRWPK